ncbi:MAG TPA: hypothetical protein VM597_03075 [Gemmataceae bacterium]|nr:hypothetical protein [Gemmataceae bacterium]
MRRKIALLAVLGGLTAGLGCQHIGGKSDCGYHPSDYAIGSPTPPYPTYPVVSTKEKVVVPEKSPVKEVGKSRIGGE